MQSYRNPARSLLTFPAVGLLPRGCCGRGTGMGVVGYSEQGCTRDELALSAHCQMFLSFFLIYFFKLTWGTT